MSMTSKRAREGRRMGAAGGEKKLEEAAKATLQPDGDDLSPEEQEALGEAPEGEGDDEEELDGVLMAEPGANPPEWAVVPDNLKLPPGKQIYFLRIPAEWTDKPGDGERQCIMWNLTMADEDLALTRARGSHLRVNRELSMAMVRAIDGVVADWTSGKASSPGNVRAWFNAIGARGRMLVQNVYLRTHQVDMEQKRRFFADCFAVMGSH